MVAPNMRHRGQQLPYDPERKVRTPEHVIADLSYNFLERKVLQRGHWLDSPRNDYGIDATMFHHDQRGEVENGEVRFQLKATSKLRVSRGGEWISQAIDVRDVRYWYFEPYPVIVVVYDAIRSRGFWLHVQDFVDRNPELMDSTKKSVTLRIPTQNTVSVRAVDQFRKLSLQTVAEFRNHRGDP
jgi:hypothetical protein